MNISPIAVYGSGGFAREVAWLAHDCGREVVCFIDDDPVKTGRIVNDVPVMSCAEAAKRFPAAQVAVGIGSPGAREMVVGNASRHGFAVASLIHPRVEKSSRIALGNGVVICAGNILTTNITIADHVQINLDCTIGHDVELHQYATLAPGVHISGYVTIGRGVYIGTGATIINGTADHRLTIHEGAVVGAGACVTKSVEAGVTVVGVPAKPLSKRPSEQVPTSPSRLRAV
jgi:sugar O-acyltransferase (sialic acid O-acetyltransferase NeuD family)